MIPESVGQDWSYPGRELESMAFAVNYHRWILDIFRPFLGKRVVEVGAGAGSFSELILEAGVEELHAIEPSANMYPLLSERLERVDRKHIGHAHHGALIGVTDAIRAAGIPDSIIYVNVLEHIEDDVRELEAMYSLLSPGGHALIFVPANRWLMSNMDRALGHHRRYSIGELHGKCSAAGFTIRVESYFDILGIASWWLKYCLLRSLTIEPAAVRFYDRCIIPFSRSLETLVRPPAGKNIILVAEKPRFAEP